MRIDPERYFSQAFMRREQARLWPRVWLMAAHQSELTHGALEFECGSASLVIEAGSTTRPSARHAASGEAVRSEIWAGFVWVNLDGAAADLSSSLGPVKPLIEAYGTAGWRLESHVTTELACNWKASVDAHNEGYHVHVLHPEVLPFVDDVGQEVRLLGDHAELHVPMGRPSPRLGNVAGLGPEPSGMLRAKLTDNYHYYVFPNLQLSLYADHALVFRHRPLLGQPERAHFDQLVIRRGQGPSQSGERVRRVLPSDAAFGKVTGADLALLPALQRGMRSSGFRGPMLGNQERAISGMHAALDRWLHDDQASPYAEPP